VPTPRSPEDTDVGSPARAIATPAAISASVLAGLLAAVLSVPGALMLWVGLSVVVGRGDPTWNDGEGTWATVLGLIFTGALGLTLYFGVRTMADRVPPGVRKVVVGMCAAPAVLVHILMAVAFVG